ncbi:hypothetical protein J2W97_001934 [Paenibacillus jamilae]|nr:hypothetical protein [Paenibacillus jamilae]
MQATIPGDTQDKYSQIELAIERIKAGEQQAYEIIIRRVRCTPTAFIF